MLKKFKRINQALLDDFYYQAIKMNSIKAKIALSLPFIKLSIEKNITQISNIEKITKVKKFLDQQCYLHPPQNDLTYHEEYFCLEDLYFQKIDFTDTALISKYDKSDLSILISPNRSLSPNGIHPLIILPENLENYGDFMDGASGYSFFKLLMKDCLSFSGEIIERKEAGKDFATNPIKFFKDIGCTVSEPRKFEIMYQKRVIAWDDEKPNVIYTFGYYLYICNQINKVHN